MTQTDTQTKPIIEISKGLLIQRLIDVRGTTFIQLSATTEPKMNKTNNPLFGNVLKDSNVNTIVGFSYENMVNNAKVRELSKDVKQAALDAGVSPEMLKQFESEIGEIAKNAAEKFETADRKWGKHLVIDKKFNIETCEMEDVLSKTIIYHYKDNELRYYIQVAILGHTTPVYRYKDTGLPMSIEDIETAKSFMPPRKEGARQGLK